MKLLFVFIIPKLHNRLHLVFSTPVLFPFFVSAVMYVSLSPTKKESSDSKVLQLECCNCAVTFFQHKCFYKQYQSLFHPTCPSCVQTCSECGQENGYAKESDLVTHLSCHICEKETCMSCGINVLCDCCKVVACETCIDKGNKLICTKLKYRLRFSQRFK